MILPQVQIFTHAQPQRVEKALVRPFGVGYSDYMRRILEGGADTNVKDWVRHSTFALIFIFSLFAMSCFLLHKQFLLATGLKCLARIRCCHCVVLVPRILYLWKNNGGFRVGCASRITLYLYPRVCAWPTQRGRTAFKIAAEDGNFDSMRLLALNGADMHVKDKVRRAECIDFPGWRACECAVFVLR
jgi:hypothetical protein